MGCGASIHPSIYNETSKINGVKPKDFPIQRAKSQDPKHLRGDYSQLQVTRHERSMHFKDRRTKIFVAADEMSGKIIEEREMLSLGTRSRGTSRNTSRAASPTQTKKMLQNEDKKLTMPPVTESRATSNISNRRSEEMNGILVGDAVNDTEKSRPQQKGKKKVKKQKEKSKSNKTTESDVSQNVKPNDENEIVNDAKDISVAESKTKGKKASGKQKSKHRKDKKRKRKKPDTMDEISDTEVKENEDDSDDEQIENVADVNKMENFTSSDIQGHSDQTGIDSQTKDNNDVFSDITNTDPTVHSNVQETVAHVHFSDDLSARSRPNSTSEMDSKRG